MPWDFKKLKIFGLVNKSRMTVIDADICVLQNSYLVLKIVTVSSRMPSFRRDHNRGLWGSHPIWPNKTDWALLSSKTVPCNSHKLNPSHWFCFHLTHPLTKPHFHQLKKNFQCLSQETLILRDKAKSKVLGENGVGQEWWRSRNQHCTTQILGTWSVTSRKMVAVMHRQDAKSFLLWIRTMLPCPGWLTEGEPGYQVFSRRPTAWDHFTWRSHLGVNFLHCHSCWDLVSMTDGDQRFRVGLAWHWEGTACSLLKLSSEQLEILQIRRHQKNSVINESSFSHSADFINVVFQSYHVKTQNFKTKRNLWNHEVLTHR